MAPKKNRTAIKLSAKATRTIAAIEEQARDIQFPAAMETELRQAATQGREAQELAVAIATKNKPQTYVVAAWKVIDDASKEASAPPKRRRPYRRRTDWTTLEQRTALSLAASGYSNAEIAKNLGRSKKAVRVKLRRCGFNTEPLHGEDSVSQRQLAEALQIHRRVIREWEALGLSSRSKVEHVTSTGVVRVVRRGFIEQEALERFFETSSGVAAASRLDGVSLQCLTTLLGYDPVERDNKRQIAAAEHKNAIEAQRKRKKRAIEPGAMPEVTHI